MSVLWFVRSEIRARHDRLGFITDSDDTEPFGFLDPTHVIRACHLIEYLSLEELMSFLARQSPDMRRKKIKTGCIITLIGEHVSYPSVILL